jgi:hypothetical protein
MQSTARRRRLCPSTPRCSPLYIAHKADVSEPTEVFHNEILGRFRRVDPDVVAAMLFAALAEEARTQLLAGNTARLEEIINLNFDTRRSIWLPLDAQIQIVERPRAGPARFAGSGGAIVGVPRRAGAGAAPSELAAIANGSSSRSWSNRRRPRPPGAANHRCCGRIAARDEPTQLPQRDDRIDPRGAARRTACGDRYGQEEQGASVKTVTSRTATPTSSADR